MYTTIQNVRDISGFDNTTKITDELVEKKITKAESIVNGCIGIRYALPLAYHRQNTLSFSGTGDGTGTMAVVVNGTTYNVVIAIGMTASEAADAFRIAAADSDDFATDPLGTAEVSLISKTTSTDLTTANAEVNITSAPTTDSIVAEIGTRSDRHIPIIEHVTGEIAAALLLKENYGAEAQDTPKDGDKRMEDAQDTLAAIQGTRKDRKVIGLYDELTGVELSNSDQSEPESVPNDTTKVSTNDPTAAKATINQVF